MITIKSTMWLVFSYSLSSKLNSRHRVSFWRRLQRIGAVSPKTGVYVLPNREDCLESFQWLAQEVQQAKGEALLMKVEKFEGLEDKQLIELFQNTCKKDYEGLEKEMAKLERRARQKPSEKKIVKEEIKKLQNRFSEISGIDFFSSSKAKAVANRLKALEDKMNPEATTSPKSLPSASVKEYQNKTWVTRPRPHVDRLACIWLIKRFIDKDATFSYSNTPDADEIPFDMKGVLFGHCQDYCSFETMMIIFNLKEAALKPIAEIIHEIDLRDGKYNRPETEGIASVLKGWALSNFSDQELESRGVALFEGLYTAFNRSHR